MLEWFEFFDLNVSLAPRPYILTEGRRTRDLLKLRKAWEIASVPENFEYHYLAVYQNPENRAYDEANLFEYITPQEHQLHTNGHRPGHHFLSGQARMVQNIHRSWTESLLNQVRN